MVLWLPRTFQLQAILSQLQIMPGTGINKFLSMKNLPLRDTLSETSFNLCSGWRCSLLTGIRRGHIRNLRLECPWNVSGSSEHPVWKKHHGELFNLISNCLSTHFCVPAVSLFSLLSCIHSVYVCLSKINFSVKAFESDKLWKSAVPVQTTVLEDEISTS